jgi:hypothetical protein
MKLKDYLDTLNEMVKTNPALLELEVVYSSDDEGNRYGVVLYSPTPGKFDQEEFDSTSKKPNAICVN